MSNGININQKSQKLIIYIALVVITFAVFWQVNRYDFITFDDNIYVTENSHVRSGLTLDGFYWALTTKDTGLWNPLVWLSFMLDYELIGMNAGGYHLTNLILHILSTLLLFWLFCRMTKVLWPGAFVAALFALHPLHVESVAWIAERKDVLSAFFWMLTLCLYVWYTEKPVIKRYLLVLFSFVLALASKPMVVTLPLILILLDYWPLNRFVSKKDNLFLWQLKEKAPFFLLSAIIVFITLDVPEKTDSIRFTLAARMANMPLSFVAYLEKTFWPRDLAVFYPFPEQILILKAAGAFLLILVITAYVIYMSRRLPPLFVGWMWYAITLLPVIKIVQAGKDAMADRYHYLPSIGIAVALAWGIPALVKSQSMRKKILWPLGIIVVGVMSVLSWEQCHNWKNSAVLFRHALRVTEDNYLAHTNLAPSLLAEGKIEEAIYHYSESLRVMPRYVFPKSQYMFNNRGIAYARLGKYSKAVDDYKRAMILRPDYPDPWYNRGSVYDESGRYREALEDYDKAITLDPHYADAYNRRGGVYFKLGRYNNALDDFNAVIAIKPDCTAFNNRGGAFAIQGRYQDALNDFNTAIFMKPEYADAHSNRAAVLFKQGEEYNACRDAQIACDLGNCKVQGTPEFRKFCR